jgi:hypothetical protein
MNDRQAARVAGLLFITATVPFSLSVVLLAPVLESVDYLVQLANNPSRVSAGVLLEIVNHVSVAAISVVLYPVLRRSSQRLAVGYVAARSIEAALFALATANLLMLTQLSHETVSNGREALSGLLLAGHNWNQVTLPFVAFALGALILNYTLYETRLVPRWISLFGLLAATSILVARLLLIGGVELSADVVTAMDAPIFAQEMVFAGWLIARGFTGPADVESPAVRGTL